MENNYLHMQKNGELEILNYKHDKDGRQLFRIRWGGLQTTNHFYTWEPKERLALCKDQLEDYLSNQVFVHT